MSNKTLQHGVIVGLRCPHCELVAQRTDDHSNALSGLDAHVRVVHPELYGQWVKTFRGSDGSSAADTDTSDRRPGHH
jgi:hypothetical protein